MEAKEHDSCGTPDCCGGCDTATKMVVVENDDNTKTILFVPINESEPKP